MSEPLAELRAYLATIDDLQTTASILGWDQRTYMPPGGAEARANQLTTLSSLIHEHSTADKLGQLIEAAAAAVSDSTSVDGALVRLARRDFEHSRKLPADLVAELAHTRSIANQVWQQARSESNFGLFAPYLQHTVELSQRMADCLGYTEHPYDALLDQYEPGMTTAQVRTLFGELQAGIVPLVKAIAPKVREDDDQPLHQSFDADKQLAFGWQVITDWGFDPSRGRQDKTVHPFCTSFSVNDVRITTRVYPDFLSPALFGTMHETGHALYELGINPELERTPVGKYASLGIHESQSRMWENLVGRSRPFWERYYPNLQQTFPQLQTVGLDRFYKAINTVKPSFIRVEADELTYNLHILLRFEFETALLEGKLAVADVPEAWSSRMQELLGVTPPNDAEGCLQDVHWSGGMLGYFPTYTLGNVLSVQLWEAAQRAEPGLRAELDRAEYGGLLRWLRTNVHHVGSQYEPNDLIIKATGEPLSAKPYLNYLDHKFRAVYEI